jgi:hypothetical protein
MRRKIKVPTFTFRVNFPNSVHLRWSLLKFSGAFFTQNFKFQVPWFRVRKSASENHLKPKEGSEDECILKVVAIWRAHTRARKGTPRSFLSENVQKLKVERAIVPKRRVRTR